MHLERRQAEAHPEIDGAGYFSKTSIKPIIERISIGTSNNNSSLSTNDVMDKKENDNRLEEWYTQHFSCLERLNRHILEHQLFIDDDDDNCRYHHENLRANHEQIQILLDIWNDMPDDETRHVHQEESAKDDHNDKDDDEPKEVTLYELLQLTGETFLCSEICSSKQEDLDLAIALLQHAMNLGHVIFSNNDDNDDARRQHINESMFVILAELGIAYDQKDMISESIEHLQMAQSIGEELFDKYYRRSHAAQDDDTSDVHSNAHRPSTTTTTKNNKTEFLTRMIVVCTILGELFDSIDNFDSAIGAYQQATKYFDYDNTDVDHFEEMLRLMDEVGKLALEKEEGSTNTGVVVDDSIVEHVKLGVELRESHVGEYNPEMISSLSILRDLYIRNGDTSKASQLSERILAIGSNTTQVQEANILPPN